MSNTCLLFDASGQIAHQGLAPVLSPEREDLPAYPIGDGLVVQRLKETRTEPEWHRPTDRLAVYALGVLGFRERTLVDPVSGGALNFEQPTVGRTSGGAMVFPRIDPAVIGRIELKDEERILLGRNTLRPDFYSLIAGYVDLGETFEEAMSREAMEEAGRRIEDIEYKASQPWPYSGSLMVGMSATTEDEHPVAETDGELADVVWASRDDIEQNKYPLPRKGSIALRLIGEWMNE